jgi:hypothetical protein
MTSYTQKSDLSNVAAKHLKDKMVAFVATDLRPFKAVEGTGFLELCQTFVDLGAKYGHFDVQKNLPSRMSVSRHVDPMVNEVKECVKKELQDAKFIALTSDGWTDDFRKISYITVTASYFNSKLELCSRILNTGEVEERKTADVLGRIVAEVVEDYGFNIANVTIVTDNATNMVAAFRNRCCRLSCFAHCLNLVMVDVLAAENTDFQSLLTACKLLVRHFKHTGLQRKLKRTLKQECPTRWNSTYIMLESILSQYDEVYDVLSKRKELKFMHAIDKDTLSHVVNFLEHFKIASEKACSDRYPSLHFVVPLYQQLLKACTENDDDIECVKLLKGRAKQLLPQKVRLDVMHDVGVFLNPCMKGLSFLTSARRKSVLEKVQQLINEVIIIIIIIM